MHVGYVKRFFRIENNDQLCPPKKELDFFFPMPRATVV